MNEIRDLIRFYGRCLLMGLCIHLTCLSIILWRIW